MALRKRYFRYVLQQSHRLHAQSFGFAFQDTYAAAVALLGVNGGFEFLGTGHLDHINSTEHAAFDTYLATIAQFLVYLRLKAALRPVFTDVSLVGIKRLMVPEKTTQDVFERMKADRKVKTDTILAAGKAEADRIRSDADAKQKELLAVADSQAQAIRGAGDAEAAGYYKELEADPDLAMFLRDLEALKVMLKERTTLILGTDVEPIQLLKEMPKLEPKQR